jgi:hypothetical protein
MPDETVTITREQALKILCRVTDQDNFWEMAVEDAVGFEALGDGEGPYPDIYDTFRALGVSEDEVNRAMGVTPPEEPRT